MNVVNHKILLLLSEAAELGMPTDDLIELVRANIVGSPVESVMRIRALTELSTHADATTLIALAVAASSQGEAVNEIVMSLAQRRH